MSGFSFPLAEPRQVGAVVRRHIAAVPGAGRQALGAVLLLSLGAAATVAVPWQLGRIVDIVLTGEGSLLTAAVLLVLSAVAGGVFSAVGFYVLSRLTERIIADLREQMVGTALGLPVHRVEDAGSGDLVSRSTDDVAHVSSAVTDTLPILSGALFTVSATVVALLGLNWRFLLVVALVAPVHVLAARRYLQVAPERYAAERASMADRARRVLEAIHGRRTVRAFRLEDRMHENIRESSQAVVDNGFSARLLMLLLQVFVSLGEFLVLAGGLLVGYLTVRDGVLTVGAVTAAMLMLIRLRGPLFTLMRVLDTVQSGYASLARIVGVVIDPPPTVPDSGAGAPEGHARMEHVSFSYDGVVRAVDGFSLRLTPGCTVALVGASGAGKTTVAALLAGLRIPDEGTVLVDGMPVAELSDRERIARLAMISQDVHVFSGTLREDLTLAKEDATDQELLDVLARVRADWFHGLPRGLDTVVGARGHQLDPVAAQQLALARILLLDPRIVVMDEATAEAGSAGAGELEAAAEEVTHGRAALVVAHRLDQAARADHVIVMDRGRIVEEGPHEELVARGGPYTELWAAWSKGRQ